MNPAEHHECRGLSAFKYVCVIVLTPPRCFYAIDEALSYNASLNPINITIAILIDIRFYPGCARKISAPALHLVSPYLGLLLVVFVHSAPQNNLL